MSDDVPSNLLVEGTGTGAGAGTGDCVMSDAIPFVSLTVRTEAGTEFGNGVICDAIPFDSLAAGTEEPTPQSPTIPISTPIPIAP